MSFFQKLKNNLGIEESPKKQLPSESEMKQGIESEIELKIETETETPGFVKDSENLASDKNSPANKISSIGLSDKVKKIFSKKIKEQKEKKGGKEKKKEKKEKERKKPEKEKKDGQNLEQTSQWQAQGELVIDVFETDSEFCVQSPIAGINPEDLDISVENEMLIIKGERKKIESEKKRNYFYQECYWGPFSRKIIIPQGADVQKIKISLTKGILNIEIPKL